MTAPGYRGAMKITFTGEPWSWRGPSPFHSVTVPGSDCERFAEASEPVSSGWGMVPVDAAIRATVWSTSLWPKDGGSVIPVKAAVRSAERLELGDAIARRLTVAV